MLGMIALARVTLGRGSWLAQGPLLVHVGAGVAATVTGFTALAVAKGGDIHRRIGTWFVYAMLVMGLVGAAIAAFEVKIGSVNGGLLAAYLVVTALTAVRPRSDAVRRTERIGMLVVLAAGATNVVLALDSLLKRETMRDGVPLAVWLIFGAIALACGASDIRMLRLDGLRGPARLTRHLWRMCFALFVASGSFFLGQAHVFPRALRIMPLLAVPAFLPLLVLVYWLWRIRLRRTLRGLVLRERPGEDAVVGRERRLGRELGAHIA
jgi:uncharacterized membrane protein